MAEYHEVKHESGKEKAKKLHHIRTRKMGDGIVVSHHANHEAIAPFDRGYEEMPYHEKYFSPDQGQELLAHLGKHLRTKHGMSPETGEAEEPYREPEGGTNRAKSEPKRTEEELEGED